VLLGLTVPLSALAEVGPRALPVVAVAVLTAFATATVLGRLLGVRRDLRLLLGAGTGICGASAIAATAGVLRPRAADVSYALSVVVVMNLLAIAVLPPLARTVGLSDGGFGAWVGASVNDTSAVVALAGGWSGPALAVAVVVKLTRVLALVPVTLVLAWSTAPAHGGGAGSPGDAPPGVPGWSRRSSCSSCWRSCSLRPGSSLRRWSRSGHGCRPAGRVRAGRCGPVDAAAGRGRAGLAPVLLGALVWTAVVAASLLTLRLVGLG
jgi:hypothetical protein